MSSYLILQSKSPEPPSSLWQIANLTIGGSSGEQPFPDRTSPGRFIEAVMFCLRTDVQQGALCLQRAISADNGPDKTIELFHRSLSPHIKNCSIAQELLATFYVRSQPSIHLSAAVASVLLEEQVIEPQDLKMSVLGRASFSRNDHSSSLLQNVLSTLRLRLGRIRRRP